MVLFGSFAFSLDHFFAQKLHETVPSICKYLTHNRFCTRNHYFSKNPRKISKRAKEEKLKKILQNFGAMQSKAWQILSSGASMDILPCCFYSLWHEKFKLPHLCSFPGSIFFIPVLLIQHRTPNIIASFSPPNIRYSTFVNPSPDSLQTTHCSR
jgi:hypothetical protein